MKIQDFKKEDWVMERVSDWREFDNYRNTKTNEVIDSIRFDNKVKDYEAYLRDDSLLREFRSDCLPFGEYPDIVIQEFLEKKYNKKVAQ